MSKVILSALLAIAAFTGATASAASAPRATDHCAMYTTCDSCVAQALCGWCSENVVYPGNVTGAQCAGFEPHQPTPFACNGVYSTETCFRGYKCNKANYECELAPPGDGVSKTQCEANCTNHGGIYLCNHTDKKCYKVPPGTKHAKSLSECEAACVHPSPHPAPPPPSQTPAPLFACNHTTGDCLPATAGKGEAKSVCEAQCKKETGQYICNKFLHKCEKLPHGVPGGETLAKCEEACTQSPHPHPPPNLQEGLYRGVQIQKGYEIGEADMDVNETLVSFVQLHDGKITGWWKGTPEHVTVTGGQEMWVTITSASSSAAVGKVIKTLTLNSMNGAQPGPNTAFVTTAMGTVGGPAPPDVKTAMTDEGFTVFAFARCKTSVCVFTLPSASPVPPELAGLYRGKKNKKVVDNNAPHRHFVRTSEFNNAVEDHCSKHDSSCADCLKHQFCGWCSVNVTYKDGSTGTQCAGFNSPSSNSSAAFACAGRYSTLNCEEGYLCDKKNFSCQITTPGNGMKSKKICEQFCHATPPPTPPVKQYVCNTTLKQCFPCNKTHCAGSMPKGPCEQACVHPKHGPHGNLIGVWRGLYIQNGYKRIEVEMVFNKTSVSIFHSGVYAYWCNVTTFGADAMVFEVMDGKYKGWKYGTIYQVSQEVPDNMYSMITLAAGKYGQGNPQGYTTAMSTQGMREYVLAKCNGSPCKFETPKK